MSLSLSPLSTSSSGSANKQQQSANKNKKLATNLPRFWLSTFSQEGQPQWCRIEERQFPAILHF